MQRRWFGNIHYSKAWKGVYATKWEGFRVAWKRGVGDSRIRLQEWPPEHIRENKGNICNLGDIREVCGVYVFLSRQLYVLYVGESKRLAERINVSYKGFPVHQRNHIIHFAAHQAINQQLAKSMESDLLWYYTPPWNTRYD
jgi:hypothetical protein